MRTTLITAAILAGLALPTAAFPSGASAQMRAVVQPFGEGRTLPVQLYGTTAGSQPISLAECQANLPIQIDVTNIPATELGGTRVFAVYRAAPDSGMCTDPTRRTAATGATPPCVVTDVPAVPITNTMMTLTPTIQQLFGATACDTETVNNQEFWFLSATSSPDTSTTVTAWFTVKMTLDTQPPAAVVLDSNPGGDEEITVTWDNPAGLEALYGANAYVDPAGCDASGNVLGTSTLVAGADPPSSATTSATGTSIAAIPIDATGLEYGQYVAVAVTILDRARNESKLSNVVCAQRVQTSGFWDAYCADRGITDPAMCRAQYGCSARPGRAGGAAGVLGLVGLALAFLVTRRARRSSR